MYQSFFPVLYVLGDASQILFNMGGKQMIKNYFISNCLLIINDLSEYHRNKSDKELKDFSDLDFSEADLQAKLYYPLGNMAQLRQQGNFGDIRIPSKDFIVEVKYLRNFNNASNIRNQKAVWKEAFEKDYNWLTNEIKLAKKGKRAFILGWFNLEGRRFSDIMQLGTGIGKNPLINKKRMLFFPFLNYNPDTNKINDISYIYNSHFKEHDINIPGFNDDKVTCMFIGQKNDKFHFALYY